MLLNSFFDYSMNVSREKQTTTSIPCASPTIDVGCYVVLFLFLNMDCRCFASHSWLRMCILFYVYGFYDDIKVSVGTGKYCRSRIRAGSAFELASTQFTILVQGKPRACSIICFSVSSDAYRLELMCMHDVCSYHFCYSEPCGCLSLPPTFPLSFGASFP